LKASKSGQAKASKRNKGVRFCQEPSEVVPGPPEEGCPHSDDEDGECSQPSQHTHVHTVVIEHIDHHGNGDDQHVKGMLYLHNDDGDDDEDDDEDVNRSSDYQVLKSSFDDDADDMDDIVTEHSKFHGVLIDRGYVPSSDNYFYVYTGDETAL
jgi:hypothetical protein